jgi:septum formation protein
VRFSIVTPDVDEVEEGVAEDVAVQNAKRKAAWAAASAGATPVLAVDTVVSLDGRIYGKPADLIEARGTLEALSGERHVVMSGVCVIDERGPRTRLAHTGVRFRALGAELVDWYLASGEWRERAGGYAIQGRGAALVEAIEGDYTNVVGLPVPTLLELLPGLLEV